MPPPDRKSPASLRCRAGDILERNTGFEPATFALARRPYRAANGLCSSPGVHNQRHSFGADGDGGSASSPTISSVHSDCVPQLFQDGARPLDVAQVVMLVERNAFH